jgi:ubiquinone/menaquinone biosynthesis C-methylase UbiE
LLFYALHDFKNPEPILEELNRVLKPEGLLAVIDKFDNDKVVSVIGNAKVNLKLKDTGIKNGKRKGKMLIFSKN